MGISFLLFKIILEWGIAQKDKSVKPVDKKPISFH